MLLTENTISFQMMRVCKCIAKPSCRVFIVFFFLCFNYDLRRYNKAYRTQIQIYNTHKIIAESLCMYTSIVKKKTYKKNLLFVCDKIHRVRSANFIIAIFY